MESHDIDVLQSRKVTQRDVDTVKHLYQQMESTDDPNQMYMICYKILSLAKLKHEIPRIVVFGQQSMGKTTLLDTVMGGPLGYSSNETGTTRPIVFIISPSRDANIHVTINGRELDIGYMQAAMKEIMVKNKRTIISDELEVYLEIPNAVHAILVDLPGIKDDTKEGAETTRKIVREYVFNNPNDLYVLVNLASTDPANLPYRYRQFISTEKPKGLGLSASQTTVVATRSAEFLKNESTEINDKGELWERIVKRSLTDKNGVRLIPQMLELFSLPIEVKESSNFALKREHMSKQLQRGQKELHHYLKSKFQDSKDRQLNKKVDEAFSISVFRKNLNLKFLDILHRQTGILESNLTMALTQLDGDIQLLKQSMVEKAADTVLNSMRSFFQTFNQYVQEFISGDYPMINLKDHGRGFLDQYGSTLTENLESGHKMAIELFSHERNYDPNTLDRLNTAAIQYLESVKAQRREVRANQFLRFHISRENSYILGKFQKRGTEDVDGKQKNVAFVEFFFKKSEESQTVSLETSKLRAVDPTKMTRLVPFTDKYISLDDIPRDGRLVFIAFVRKDDWIGLQEISPDDLILDHGSAPQTPPDPRSEKSNKTEIMVHPQLIYVDAYVSEEVVKAPHRTTNQLIVGDFAESKILNETGMTLINRWFKFVMQVLTPHVKYEEGIMMQMMRSARNVMDKSHWEPLLADMLQTTVKESLSNLCLLVTCASASYLRKIFEGTLHAMIDMIEQNRKSSMSKELISNPIFMLRFEKTMTGFCHQRARECAENMDSLLLEQTSAINFHNISDIVHHCTEFERNFLYTDGMVEFEERVNNFLMQRSKKINSTDMFTIGSTNRDMTSPYQLLLDELALHFWASKINLNAPLAMKLYIYFIKEFKDQSGATGRKKRPGSVGFLEESLQDSFLVKWDDGLRAFKGEAEIVDEFQFRIDTKKIEQEIEEKGLLRQYLSYTCYSIHRLREVMSRGHGVNFLDVLGSKLQDRAEEEIN